MTKRILKDGSESESFDSPVDLIIHTKSPGKWKLIDLETGEEYLGSEIGTNFGFNGLLITHTGFLPVLVCLVFILLARKPYGDGLYYCLMSAYG